MGTMNPDWYAAQATRAYPLDDGATARDDAGLELPPQILVDCRVRFPNTLGRFAYVGGVTVGPSIVTAVLMAAPDSARPPAGEAPGTTGLQAIGAVSLPRPVQPNRHYPITPMAPGVGGWLVFGRGIDEPYSGRFSTPGQSLLLPRIASAYHPLPIPTMGKLGLADALEGVIQLLGGTDLEVVQDMRTIGDAQVDAIIIRLTDSLNRNVQQFYTGPCDGRPESHTCGQTVLEAINDVQPDCNGNITIDFQGVTVYDFAGGGGLALDLDLGMADTCTGQDYLPDAEGNLPSDYTGDCEPPPPPQPEGPPVVTPPGPLPSGCSAMPFYDSFDATPVSNAWVVSNGTFALEADDSPGEPSGLQAPGPGLQPGQLAGVPGWPPLHRAQATSAIAPSPVNQCYSATSQSLRNASIWNCDYDFLAGDFTAITQLKLMPGPQINGGVIFNYLASDPSASNRPTYLTAAVNLISGYLELRSYRGTSDIMAQGFPFGTNMPKAGEWYQLTVRTRISANPGPGNNVWSITMSLSQVTDPAFRPMSITTPFGVSPYHGGKFGVGSYNAYCRFSFFQLEYTPAGSGP